MYIIYIYISSLHAGEGSSLNELEMHRFLEAFDETMTVLAMRKKLRESGAITDRPKSVPITHYLLFKYNVDWHVLVNAPQGDNQAAIDEAQAKLDAVLAAYEDCRTKADVAREREADARAAEAPFKAAQEELEAALADLKAKETAYNAKTETLKKQSEEGGVVTRNRAKVQLDAHLAEGVCVCMCVYMCVCVCMCMYVCATFHVYYWCVCMCVYVCVCACVYLCVCRFVCMCVCVCVFLGVVGMHECMKDTRVFSHDPQRVLAFHHSSSCSPFCTLSSAALFYHTHTPTHSPSFPTFIHIYIYMYMYVISLLISP
jgi:hypothetical protein